MKGIRKDGRVLVVVVGAFCAFAAAFMAFRAYVAFAEGGLFFGFVFASAALFILFLLSLYSLDFFRDRKKGKHGGCRT